MKRTLSCSLDSLTATTPLSSPKCAAATSLNNPKYYAEFGASSSFSGSLFSPSSSSEMLVSSRHVTSYGSSPVTVSTSYKSQPTSSILNSPSAVFSSCMFPEIPAFSPGDSALTGCMTAHVPASGPAYVGCGAAAEAELTPGGGVSDGEAAAENGDEARVAKSTTLKRSMSETLSDDDDASVTHHHNKGPCSDSDQSKPHRTTGSNTALLCDRYDSSSIRRPFDCLSKVIKVVQ